MSDSAHDLTHRLRRMTGRDPDEHGRASSTLELLFDLTFVLAYGTAANELAHFLSAGHVAAGIVGFCFAAYAIAWAWINFSWFASAYDTDDWVYRLTTMVQMCGVLVFALGIPRMFESLIHGKYVDNGIIVLGYVIMRVALVFQWLRVAREDRERRSVGYTYAAAVSIAQVGWVIQALSHTSPRATVIWMVALLIVESSGPIIAERYLAGTPWHPHHIAERYGAVVIIALGEGMVGTLAAMTGVFDHSGWSTEFVVVMAAGVAIVFGMWWTYFVVPSGELLATHRSRSFGWGYGHIVIFGAVVAVGAGLHVFGLYLEHLTGPEETHFALGAVGTLLTVAVPLLIYLLGIFVLYTALTRTFDRFHIVLVTLTFVIVAVALAMSAAGVPLHWCLAVLALSSWVAVVGYELVGHRHNAEVLAALRSD